MSTASGAPPSPRRKWRLGLRWAALDRKLARDLAAMKVQAAAIAVVIASGVALFVGTFATYRALELSEHHHYEGHRFAHVWASVSRAPSGAARAIAVIPGVAAVEERIVSRAVLGLPGVDEPVSALFVSAPQASGHAINALYIQSGRAIDDGNTGETLVSAAFADTNGIRLGDTLAATISGRRVRLHVVGIALSPEHVMQITPAGLMDDRRFAVVWMARSELQSLLDMRDAFNDVAVRLMPGAAEASVIAEIDRVLDRYGGHGAYGRNDQASHVMLEEHIQPLRSLALLVPSIFMLVAAFLAHVVLSRVVATQREQVGLLKAFGYSSLRIAVHYLLLTLAIVALGVAIGLPFGVWLGHVMAVFYAGFFRFPVLVYRVEPWIVVLAAALAASAAVFGTLGQLGRVFAMPPTVAMAPLIPTFHETLLDRLGGARLLSAPARLVLRNLTARPLRSSLVSLGMAMAIAVVVLGDSSAGGFERMATVQYSAARHEDVSVVFARLRSLGASRELETLPGVLRAEPFRAVPARMHWAGAAQSITLVGLPRAASLQRMVASDYRVTPIPPDGVVVSAWLARRFGLRRGQRLALEIREGRLRTVSPRLVGTVDEPLGVNGYMDIDVLGRLLGEPATFSGAHLVVDALALRSLYSALKQAPNVVGVEIRRETVANFRAMTIESLAFIRRIEILFAVIIAFGVVYNSARISVSERGRELATLRIMGFSRREISGILLAELALLAVPAIPLGFGVGYALAGAVAMVMTSSRMHVPLVVDPASYAFAVTVFGIAALASALVVRRRLDQLDLIGVLKARA